MSAIEAIFLERGNIWNVRLLNMQRFECCKSFLVVCLLLIYIRLHCFVENAAVSFNPVIIALSVVTALVIIAAVILVIVVIKQRTDNKRSYQLLLTLFILT